MLPALPIDEVLPQAIAALAQSPALVLRAPPGAGKTTRLPPALLDAGFAQRGSILVLQPRRVAARATAVRIAAERQTRLGDEIGYQVRFESRVSARTRLAIITEGILLRRLQTDPFLDDVAVVVFDEFHERSLASDLALAMVRQVQQSVRPELKVVIMSATLAAQPVARYLGDCPIVESAGRTFPVEVRYAGHLERRPLAETVAEAAEQCLAEMPGDCLVFLPGMREIRECERRLSAFAERERLSVLPLYGDLPAEQQDAVLRPGERRKLILATNVAETSLTIEGVTSVIDSGLARILRYDERTGLDRLELSPVSQASADQRAGRAGRTRPGLCLRLWPAAAHRSRAEFELPEIQRVDLAGAALAVLTWIEPDLTSFPWYESPPAQTWERAQELLRQLGAAHDGAITPLGRQMAALPVHPRLGRFLIEGQRLGIAGRAALAAALLTERDPFERTAGLRRRAGAHSRSDVLDRVQALEQFAIRGTVDSDVGPLHRGGAKNVLRAAEQLWHLAAADQKREGGDDDAFLRAIVAAYPDRLARRREPGSRRGVMIGGRGVRLADECALGDEELYVCVDIDGSAGEALVRQASAVERACLSPELVRVETTVAFDEATERVTARKQTWFDTLLLEESQAALPPGEAVAKALAEAARPRLDRVIPADNDAVLGFLNRVRCLCEWMPDLNLTVLDNEALRGLLPELAQGRRSFAELRDAPWLMAMKSLYNWQQLQSIDREAPERIEVPSGNQIRVQYEPGQPPILAVRIQEVFGLRETPRVAGSRVPVLLHLLAPSMRVAQVTSDLASFWSSSYALVRKDLRARYPKHAWPEDPTAATAERRPRKKT